MSLFTSGLPLLDPKHLSKAARVEIIVTPILHERKLRPREVKLLIQSHTASQLPLCPGLFCLVAMVKNKAFGWKPEFLILTLL